MYCLSSAYFDQRLSSRYCEHAVSHTATFNVYKWCNGISLIYLVDFTKKVIPLCPHRDSDVKLNLSMLDMYICVFSRYKPILLFFLADVNLITDMTNQFKIINYFYLFFD